MQTLIVHSRRPIFFWRDLGPRRAVAATTLIVGAIFGCLFWPAFAVGTIWRALTVGQGAMSPWREMSDVFTYILALSGVWTILLPAVIAAKFRGLKVTASVLVLLPVYYLLVSAATWVAMLDQVLRPHYWAKTAHGRSRQRPSPLVPPNAAFNVASLGSPGGRGFRLYPPIPSARHEHEWKKCRPQALR